MPYPRKHFFLFFQLKVNRENNTGISVYLHIPFCLKKCNYCDFISFGYSFGDLQKYLLYLKKEIDIFFSKFPASRFSLKSLYLGGGTPSLMSAELLSDLVEHLSKYFDFSTLIEFTIEANPETVEFDKFKELRQLGVNRVSLGAQSFDNESLKLLGRVHDSKKIYKSFEILRKSGFDNINLDLMFALPEETIEDVIFSLSEAIKLSPEHISFYSLTIERGTKFFKIRDSLGIPQENEQAKHYKMGIKLLEGHGYKQYEISNFSKEGFQSIHNLSYWLSFPYAGFGIAAGSFISRIRRRNVLNLKSYYEKIDSGMLPIGLFEHLTEKRQKGEYIMMCLRLKGGCKNSLYYDRFGVFPVTNFGNEISNLSKMKLLKADKEGFSLTSKGLLIANQVMEYFI